MRQRTYTSGARVVLGQSLIMVESAAIQYSPTPTVYEKAPHQSRFLGATPNHWYLHSTACSACCSCLPPHWIGAPHQSMTLEGCAKPLLFANSSTGPDGGYLPRVQVLCI